jgi:hypothetical protein
MSRRILLLSLASFVSAAATVESAPIRVIDLLGGDTTRAVSYAVGVETYDPVFLAGAPGGDWADAANALGLPDYSNRQNFASLGLGGSLVLRFTEGALTGSGDSAFDLIVAEVGPDVEDTLVWISANGTDWISLGRVAGGTTGVDLDAFGFDQHDAFSFVRLMDDPNQGLRSGLTVGADIDSVAVARSMQAPEPSVLVLLATGLTGLAAGRMLRRTGRGR